MSEFSPLQTAEASNIARKYREAADQGYPQAQANLGNIFLEGLIAMHSISEAELWYRKAADQGHPLAQTNLGAIY